MQFKDFKMSVNMNKLDGFTCAPILLIAFNRPEFLRDQISQISKVKPRRIFIAVDGARNEAEEKICAQTRAAVKLIDWDC
jgi:hypothetical protein